MFKYVTHDIKANAIVDYMNLIEPNSATFTKQAFKKIKI